MKTTTLPKSALEPFVALLANFGEVHAPVSRAGGFVFERLDDIADLRLDYVRTLLPPKKYVLPPRELSTPTRLLSSYYREVNRRQFARAYTYWEDLGKASNQSFAHFEQGYADTDHVVVSLGKPRVEGAAGSLFASVPVRIVATLKNQTKQNFRGTYVLRRSDIPPFDKLGWRIHSAQIEQTSSSN